MTKTTLACIVLAAGTGTRMKSAVPKSLHPIAGRPGIEYILETIKSLNPERIIGVTAPEANEVRAAFGAHKTIIQKKPLGTGDAVKAALPALEGFSGDVLILLGDMPLIGADTLRALIAARHKDAQTGVAVLGVTLDHPGSFGRLVLGRDGGLMKIVEDKDCTPDERGLKLCNTGAFCVDGARLAGWVESIGNNNAQKEFYITDLVALAVADGLKAHVHVTHDLDEVRGVNSRADLAALETIVQNRLRRAAMDNGATLTDPASVYLSWDTKLGRDVTVEPGVFFAPGVSVANGAHIRAYSYLEGAKVGENAVIGPFARLRPGTVIGAESKIGNFVEIKNAILGEGVKASHLAYIGDAELGPGVNFSCGAITVNYDGEKKHKTVIGARAMIGSNVNLVAPLSVGDGAYIAAGSTITKDVPPDALAVARERPMIKDGWASARRKKKTGS